MTGLARSAVLRFAGLSLLWLALAPWTPADAALGLAAVSVGCVASLRLLPPRRHGVRLLALPGFALRFIAQSCVAGFDVARRALSPALPIRPGLITVPSRFADPAAAESFAVFSCLLPGTLPAGATRDGLIPVHCLDTGQDVAAQVARDQAAFARLVEARDG
jgi:multicomponent Na+:H+ antiporter subunit E